MTQYFSLWPLKNEKHLVYIHLIDSRPTGRLCKRRKNEFIKKKGRELKPATIRSQVQLSNTLSW